MCGPVRARRLCGGGGVPVCEEKLHEDVDFRERVGGRKGLGDAREEEGLVFSGEFVFLLEVVDN